MAPGNLLSKILIKRSECAPPERQEQASSATEVEDEVHALFAILSCFFQVFMYGQSAQPSRMCLVICCTKCRGLKVYSTKTGQMWNRQNTTISMVLDSSGNGTPDH